MKAITRSFRRRFALPAAASAVRSCALEALEPRQLMAIFANGIDSNNLGKGMWAWTLSDSQSNDGYGTSTSNQAAWFGYLRNTMHLDYLITKAGSGDSLLSQYSSAMVTRAHAAGLKIVPYFYIYGDASDTSPASHHSSTEASVFNSVFDTGGPGGDFAIFDIEGEYGDSDSAGLINYFNLIHKSAAGDGSGSRDNLFMAYSSFDILHFHNTQFPVKTIADYCDAAMPQMYWKAHGGVYTQAYDLAQVDADYKNTTLVGVNGVKPVIPTGQTYDSGNGLPTASETNVWYNLIKNDTSAIGPAGVSGYRYKSFNYFDEHTTTAALRTEIAAETIGDLPGTPATPSPANSAALASGTVTLDWADVVNTYGTNSVGAATSYDVYVDGVLKANVTASQYAVPSTLSSGSHTWQVKANDMFGTTAGPTWSFTVAGGPVTAPSSLAISTYGSNSATLTWADNSNNESKFLIERKTGAGGFSQIGTVNANVITYTDTSALPNTSYSYQVRGWDGLTTYSAYTAAVAVTTLAATPTNLAASDGAFTNRVALTWTAATGATAYQVYRNTVNNSSTATLLDTPTATTYDDAAAAANTTYYYWVASLNSASVAGAKSTVDSGYADTIAPSLASKSYQGQYGPPYVAFTFSENVAASVNIASITLTNLDDAVGAVPVVASYQYTPGANTAKFYLDPTLPNGNFQATVAGVVDAAGNAMAGSVTQAFTFLRGDANGDRVVNGLDFNALASHFGYAGAGVSGGDFDFDGTVGVGDFTALGQNWATVLPAAPAAPLALAKANSAGASLFGSTAIADKQVLSSTAGDPLQPLIA